MLRHYKQAIIAAVTFIGGLYYFLEFMLPESLLEALVGQNYLDIHQHISRGTIFVGTMAIGLGIINLFRVHGKAIIKKKKGWINSLALVVGIFATLFVEYCDFRNAERQVEDWKQIADLGTFASKILEDHKSNSGDAARRTEFLSKRLESVREKAQSSDTFLNSNAAYLDRDTANEFREQLVISATLADSLYQKYLDRSDLEKLDTATNELSTQLKKTASLARDIADANYQATAAKQASTFIHEAFFVPLGSAMFSLLAFYVATAAYRTFRVRSLEAFLMMTAAIIVMLGQIPHGPLYVSTNLPGIRLWLLENISTPAFRAVVFGSAVAGLAMAIRMWLSLERSPLATDELPTINQKGV